MSEAKANKNRVSFQNDQEPSSWLKTENNLANEGSMEKSRKEKSQKHREALSPDTADESFQEIVAEKKMHCVTFSSNEECSQILPFNEEKSNISRQTENEGECASLILACLFCHFCDFLLMLPSACENLITNTCCPSHRYYHTSEDDASNNDCGCGCDVDCGLFDVCQESSECLELAMEISEVCYH